MNYWFLICFLGIGSLCEFGNPTNDEPDYANASEVADVQCGSQFTVVLYKSGYQFIIYTNIYLNIYI